LRAAYARQDERAGVWAVAVVGILRQTT
jgi:hypothetical protein